MLKTVNVYIDMIQFQLFLQGQKRVGSPTKDAFELHCLRVDYQAKYWLNANNVQMDVGAATDTGGRNLGGGPVVIDALFDVAPIVCEACMFCPYFAMHYSHVVSFPVLQSS